MKLIVANYKSALTKEETLELVKKLREIQDTRHKTQVVICPGKDAIADVAKLIEGTHIVLGAQDSTEAIPGCRYVIVGHSDRRKLGDTDQIVERKFRDVMERGMIPILCMEKPDQIIASSGEVAYAYEPLWAIGSDHAAPLGDVEEVLRDLRARAQGAKLLYGGSVDEANAGQFLASPLVDGLLVGRASLDADRFSALLSAV